MTPALLIREVSIALLGGLAAGALHAFTPLQDGIKRVLQGAVLLATLATMAHVGGIW